MSSLFDFDAPPDQYAVMGNPVTHSKSPRIHTMFAKQTEQHMEYTAIQVDAGGLAQAIGNFQSSGGKGLNITVPYKHEAWELLNDCSDNAEQAGAVNTISFHQDGTMHGDNTDGIGLVHDIMRNHGYELNGRSILLIGAGGAASGVVGALLAEQPKSIVIANRTVDKAITLAEKFSSTTPVRGCSFTELEDHRFDLIINATSASLHGEVPAIPAQTITPDSFCYDMMYGNEPTAFMRWCASAGAVKTLDGLGMLIEQAAEAFTIWRGIRPDTRIVIEELRKDKG